MFVPPVRPLTAAASPPQPANENVLVGKADGPKKLTVEHIYQKKTQLEHILLRPDTYIGSVELVTQVGAGGSEAEPPEPLGAGGESLAAVYKAQNICLSITKQLLYKLMRKEEGLYPGTYRFLLFFPANVGF